MQTQSEKETQKIYKNLSEATTVLFDALIYGEAELSDGMISVYISSRDNAKNKMGQDWVNTVIEQSFKLIIDRGIT